jgi:hypothetical protein
MVIRVHDQWWRHRSDRFRVLLTEFSRVGLPGRFHQSRMCLGCSHTKQRVLWSGNVKEGGDGCGRALAFPHLPVRVRAERKGTERH